MPFTRKLSSGRSTLGDSPSHWPRNAYERLPTPKLAVYAKRWKRWFLRRTLTAEPLPFLATASMGKEIRREGLICYRTFQLARSARVNTARSKRSGGFISVRLMRQLIVIAIATASDIIRSMPGYHLDGLGRGNRGWQQRRY